MARPWRAPASSAAVRRIAVGAHLEAVALRRRATGRWSRSAHGPATRRRGLDPVRAGPGSRTGAGAATPRPGPERPVRPPVPGSLGPQPLSRPSRPARPDHGEVVGVGDTDAAARPGEDPHRARPVAVVAGAAATTMSAHHLGQEHLGVVGEAPAVRHRRRRVPSRDGRRWHGVARGRARSTGWKPHRFIETGVSPGSTLGSRPSSALKVPSSWRRDHAAASPRARRSVPVGSTSHRSPGSPGRR